MRNYEWLDHNGTKYATHIQVVGSSPAGFSLKSAGTTHAASVSLNTGIVYGETLTDNYGNTYRVLRAVERLGKLRLELAVG